MRVTLESGVIVFDSYLTTFNPTTTWHK
jgi:hypothetical protein